MAFIEDALKQILSDDADVSALVSNRIYPGVLQDASPLPGVAFRVVDTEREPVLDSKTHGPTLARFVFFSVAKDISGTNSPRRMASLIDKAVRHALQGYKDVVIVDSISPAEMVDVQGIFFVTASDTFDDRTKTYQAASVFDVHFSETIPD